MATTFLKIKNNAASLLAADIAAGATELTVSTGDGSTKFPAVTFEVSIDDEIFLVSVKNVDVFTVTGEQEGTTAAAHLAGAEVRLNITAKHITDLNTAVNAVEKYADYGLSFFGAVTTYTDTTHFKVSSLAGLGASTFLPASGMPHEIFVFKADGAAPQGEQTPVVAYTTGDGTFQHAAFTAPLAVGDEVLIIHPLLASLGTKVTAAAADAVTTTDYAMAYIKQLVTQLLATDIVCDGIQTDLSNATDGLGALKDLIDAVQTDVGDPTGETLASISAKVGDIARSLDVIIGARWDASGDLGTDIAQLLTYTDILDNATNGLANIKSLIDAIQVDLGDMADAATADDLSDITTTSALAKLRRLLLRFSSGAFSVSLDGSARTDLDALYTALGVLLGARADAAIVGFPGTNAALPILKGLQVGQGLCYYGDITTYTSTTSIASTTLGGFETGFFIGWHCFLIKDDGGAGATPQGARSLVTAFTTTTGAITLATALPAAGAVGDQIMLVHPVLLDAWNMQGGVRSLETIGGEQDAELDFATVQTIASPVTLSAAQQNIYSRAGSARPFYFAGGLMSWDSGDPANQNVTINIQTTSDGTNWADMWTITLTAVPSPAELAVPSHANSALLNIPIGFWVGAGVGLRVGITQAAVGVGWHVVSHNFVDGVPSN